MLARRASISWLMVTRCSWVSSQNASSRVVRSSRVGEGLVTAGSTGGGGGGGWEVDGWGWRGGGWGVGLT